MTLSDEERRKIYEEEKAREDARKQIKADSNAKKNGKVMLFLGIGGVLLFIGVICSESMKSSKRQEAIQSVAQMTAPDTLIPYVIVNQWTLPNGGYGRTITISPKYRNEYSLRLLGQTLKYETRGEQFAFIFVYDDAKAAGMQQKVGSLSKKEEVFFDRHKLGQYTRNTTTGYHKMEITPDGLTSKVIEVNY